MFIYVDDENCEISSNTLSLIFSLFNCFTILAIEMLAEEKCFLEDVKSHFLKTAAYFFHDNKPVSKTV